MKHVLIYSVLLILFLGSSQSIADIIDDIEDLDSSPTVVQPPAKEPPLLLEPQKPAEKPGPKLVPQNAEPKKSPKEAGAKHPINLRSEGRSTYTKDGGLMILRENVVITQDQLRLQAHEARITVNQESRDAPVERVEISGQVKVSKFSDDPKERVIGHGDTAVFENSKQTVRLVGNARLFKGGHLIRGKEIVYDVQSGLITVDEAQGVVQPQESN